MKRLIPALLSLIVLFAGCEKDDDRDTNESSTLVNGLYEGTFSRTGMSAVNVSISVFGGNYQGESATEYYPAICRGSITRDNNSISFTDSCTWQANFDWSLILNGRYNISEEGNNLRIWRNVDAGMDEYLLRRLER